MHISCRWDVGARSRPAQASLGQRCASHGTIGDNIYAVSEQLGPCPNPWSKVAERMFFVVQPLFFPALFCCCRFLLFVGGCCNRWLLQPAAVPACDSTTARSDAGWPDKHGYAVGRCQVTKMRHIDTIAGGLQQANRAAQKPKMPYTGMCNGG